jgi:cytochrome c-type biogenesis protein CcmH/NrfF
MRLIFSAFVALFLGLASAAFAANAIPTSGPAFDAASAHANELANDLKSPFCPGKTLLTCTSSQAYDLRGVIRDHILQGQSDAQIVAWLQEQYGSDIANPEQPWYTFVIPFLPFAGGLALIFWAVRRWRRHAPAPAAVETPAAGPDADRLARLRRQVAGDADD